MRIRFRGYPTLLAIPMLAVSLAAPAAILPPPQQISAHVYAWIGPYSPPNKQNQGYRMNMAFVVGDKAVAVIDTGYSEAMAKEMLQHIATVTKLPVKYAINSNSQPHRSMGNAVFRAHGATVITHPKEAKRLADQGGNFARGVEQTLELTAGSVKPPAAPTRTITADTTIDLGGVVLKLKPFKAGHTPAPLAVHVPADKLVYAGDILYGGRLLAVLPDGNVKSWIQAFDDLRAFGDVTFIPGHGQPDKLQAFEFPTRAYLALLHNHMSKMIEAGVDLQTAIEKLDQSAYAKLENFEELAGRNANLTYLEREAEFFSQ
jgi:glyoxylase-like metal-dependent hydrolase (beta-lactamase superfamily II)